MPNRVRILAGITAGTCWIGLALQFALIVQVTEALSLSGGLKFPLLAAVAVFLSFLTLQITLLAAAITSRVALTRESPATTRLSSALAAYMVAGSIIFWIAIFIMEIRYYA